MPFKLGKRAPRQHRNTLSLHNFFWSDPLPQAATKVWREYKTPAEAKLLFDNDKYGDCVFAMMANKIIHDTVHTGSIVIPTLDQVLEAYSAVTGFDRKTGLNDNGTVMTEAFEYWRTVGIAGHKILAWVQIDHRNLEHRALGCQWFGATMIGVQLPNSAMEQFDAGKSFRLTWANRGMAGGHAMLKPGYGREGENYVTWAKWDQKAAASWAHHYVDEEYVVISETWLDENTGKTPGGLDINALWQNIKLLSK